VAAHVIIVEGHSLEKQFIFFRRKMFQWLI